MLTHSKDYPSRAEAEALLQWAGAQNPGVWTDHSRVAARAAETIAAATRLDPEKAYMLGLLHDIGRFEGVRHLHHTLAGYELLQGKGYEAAARICLTHSFPVQHLSAYSGNLDCSAREIQRIKTFLTQTNYDDYDRLIQLCDALALAKGVSLIEVRLLDVAMRYGFNDGTIEKWKATLALKTHFDALCGKNIYTLFRAEIVRNVFGE